jgi:hypothetical protein
MKVSELVPQARRRESFRRSSERLVPSRPGCYALATFDQTVLYVGLANNLRRRMGEHLDNSMKRAQTTLGSAIWFFWLETPQIEKIERTWINIHIQHEGVLPLLNKAYSPVGL